MLIPARVEATFTEAQTLSVVARTSGRVSIRWRSPRVNPFCTSAEYPPIKLDSYFLCRLIQCPGNDRVVVPSQGLGHSSNGGYGQPFVHDGIPYLSEIRSQVQTSFWACFLDLLTNSDAEFIGRGAGAISQADSQRHRADIQVFILQHPTVRMISSELSMTTSLAVRSNLVRRIFNSELRTSQGRAPPAPTFRNSQPLSHI